MRSVSRTSIAAICALVSATAALAQEADVLLRHGAWLVPGSGLEDSRGAGVQALEQRLELVEVEQHRLEHERELRTTSRRVERRPPRVASDRPART